MAIYYFDRNGTTAGFGTLTGNWNTTDANWSTSSAGTATPAAVTFTSSDTAHFGVTGTTSSVGTVTVSTGVNVTLNKIVFQNITSAAEANPQFITSGAGTGKITLAGTSPELQVDSYTSIASDLEGTSGFIKSGPSTLRFGNAKTLSGNVSINAGSLDFNRQSTFTTASTANYLPNISNIDIANGSSLIIYTGTTAYTFGFETITSTTNDGNLLILSGSSGVTFPAGCLTNFDNQNATKGFGPYIVTNAGAGLSTSSISVHELPRKIYIANETATANTIANILYINTSASPQTYNSNIEISGGSSFSGRIVSNGTSHMIITGGVTTNNSSQTFSVRGTNTGENEISGVISGPAIIEKELAGTWLFSGTNTFSGALNVLDGTLVISNSNSFGAVNTSDVTFSSGTTLKVRGGITAVKNSGSTFTVAGVTVENVSGINKISIPSVNLGAVTGTTTSTFTITGDSLELDGVLFGGVDRSLSKGGSGTLYLSNTASTYDGTTTATAGTLKVSKLANINTNSSLGSPALTRATITMGSNTTLSHVGTTADSTDRIITCNAASGSHFTLDSSGTGSGGVTYASGGTFTFSVSGTHNLTFTGTNSATNVFARAIADSTGGGAVSLYKTGSNTWSITGAITATGSVNCSAGTFDFDAVSRTFSGGLNVSGGIVSIGNGFTIGAATSMSGGKITAVLTGANTLTVTSGATEVSPATLQPDDNTNGNNSLTGAVSISGCVDLLTPTSLDIGSAGKGRVLGTSNTVTVNNGGIIRTKTGTVQKGRARYYNLVLGTGSTLKIGSAA